MSYLWAESEHHGQDCEHLLILLQDLVGRERGGEGGEEVGRVEEGEGEEQHAKCQELLQI